MAPPGARLYHLSYLKRHLESAPGSNLRMTLISQGRREFGRPAMLRHLLESVGELLRLLSIGCLCAPLAACSVWERITGEPVPGAFPSSGRCHPLYTVNDRRIRRAHDNCTANDRRITVASRDVWLHGIGRLFGGKMGTGVRLPSPPVPKVFGTVAP